MLLAACCLVAASASTDYTHYQTLRITPPDERALAALVGLANDAWLQEAEAAGDIDWWKAPTTIGQPADVMVAPSAMAYLNRSAFQAGLGRFLHAMVPDVQVLIDGQFHERSTNAGTKQHAAAPLQCLGEYVDYEGTQAWMDGLAAEYPELVTIKDIGTTLEGRAIRSVEIGVDVSKPRYFVQAAIHAREWIAPAVARNIVHQLVQGVVAGTEPATSMVHQFTWVIVPIVNADGYAYTWSDDRMWRKTRRDNGDGSFGVDGNRNSDVDWHLGSDDPASVTYRGPSPLSEPCVQAIFKEVRELGNVQVFWDLHSYGEQLIVPFAFSATEIPVDRDGHMRAGLAMWEAIKEVSGIEYDGPRRPNSVYSGFMMDQMYFDESVTYPGLIELRDTGTFGFLLPESEICPQSDEIFHGLAAHAATVHELLQNRVGTMAPTPHSNHEFEDQTPCLVLGRAQVYLSGQGPTVCHRRSRRRWVWRRKQSKE